MKSTGQKADYINIYIFKKKNTMKKKQQQQQINFKAMQAKHYYYYMYLSIRKDSALTADGRKSLLKHLGYIRFS